MLAVAKQFPGSADGLRNGTCDVQVFSPSGLCPEEYTPQTDTQVGKVHKRSSRVHKAARPLEYSGTSAFHEPSPHDPSILAAIDRCLVPIVTAIRD